MTWTLGYTAAQAGLKQLHRPDSSRRLLPPIGVEGENDPFLCRDHLAGHAGTSTDATTVHCHCLPLQRCAGPTKHHRQGGGERISHLRTSRDRAPLDPMWSPGGERRRTKSLWADFLS